MSKSVILYYQEQYSPKQVILCYYHRNSSERNEHKPCFYMIQLFFQTIGAVIDILFLSKHGVEHLSMQIFTLFKDFLVPLAKPLLYRKVKTNWVPLNHASGQNSYRFLYKSVVSRHIVTVLPAFIQLVSMKHQPCGRHLFSVALIFQKTEKGKHIVVNTLEAAAKHQ